MAVQIYVCIKDFKTTKRFTGAYFMITNKYLKHAIFTHNVIKNGHFYGIFYILLWLFLFLLSGASKAAQPPHRTFKQERYVAVEKLNK